MVDYDGLFEWRPGPLGGDPIGPWLREALQHKLIDRGQAVELVQIQVTLQKEAISLQRQALDIYEKGLDAVAQISVRATET